MVEGAPRLTRRRRPCGSAAAAATTPGITVVDRSEDNRLFATPRFRTAGDIISASSSSRRNLPRPSTAYATPLPPLTDVRSQAAELERVLRTAAHTASSVIQSSSSACPSCVSETSDEPLLLTARPSLVHLQELPARRLPANPPTQRSAAGRRSDNVLLASSDAESCSSPTEVPPSTSDELPLTAKHQLPSRHRRWVLRGISVVRWLNRPGADLFAIRVRVVLLAMYAILLFCLARSRTLDLPVFSSLPPAPTPAELFPSLAHTCPVAAMLEEGSSLSLPAQMLGDPRCAAAAPHASRLAATAAFAAMTHASLAAPQTLNVPVGTAFRRGLGACVAESLVLLRLGSIRRASVRKGALGLVAALWLSLQVSGSLVGGLDFKLALFPHLWEAVVMTTAEAAPGQYGVMRASRQLLAIGKAAALANNNTLPAPTSLVHLMLNPPAVMLVALYCLDVIGAVLTVSLVVRFLRLWTLAIPAAVLVLGWVIGQELLQGVPRADADDRHVVDFPAHAAKGDWRSRPETWETHSYFSLYVKAPDGARIAADVYLPGEVLLSLLGCIESAMWREFYRKGFRVPRDVPLPFCHGEPVKVPTVLQVTRYNRRMTVPWPFSLFGIWHQPPGNTVNVWSWQLAETFVGNGYAFVSVDTRGTGASSGARAVDLSPREIGDLELLATWARSQFWADGRLVSGGFSYDGMTGLAAAGRVPHMDGVLALFTPTDVIRDLIQPGGLVCTTFVEEYAGITHGFERAGNPVANMLRDRGYAWRILLGFALALRNVAPVRGFEHLLPASQAQHQSNWDMSTLVRETHFCDDFLVVPGAKDSEPHRVPVEAFGVTAPQIRRVAQRTGAVYIVGGYCDSSSTRGSAKLLNGLREGRDCSRRIIPSPAGDDPSPAAPRRIAEETPAEGLPLRGSVFPPDSDCDNNDEGQGETNAATTVPPPLDDEGAAPAGPVVKLTLGPWSHTGRRNCSPFGTGTFSKFEHDLYPDMLAFMDCYVRGRCWGPYDPATAILRPEIAARIAIAAAPSSSFADVDSKDWTQKYLEAPVNFWLTGEERWVAAEDYPPPDVASLPLQMQPTLASEPVVQWAPAEPSWSYRMRERAARALHQLGKTLRLKNEAKETSPLATVGAEQSPPVLSLSFPGTTAEPQEEVRVKYIVDYASAALGFTRWSLAKHPFRMLPMAYSAMHGAARLADIVDPRTAHAAWVPFTESSSGATVLTGRHLQFRTGELKKPLRIAGAPLLRFAIDVSAEIALLNSGLRELFLGRADTPGTLRINQLDPVAALDVTVFAYLMDVDVKSGIRRYVTEGRTLLSHRPVVAENVDLGGWEGCHFPPQTMAGEPQVTETRLRQRGRVGSADVVNQPGNQANHRFTVGGVECVVLTLEPVAWTFQPGHMVELALAGSDTGNFDWQKTEEKESVDLLAQELMAKAATSERLRDLRHRPVEVRRPAEWNIPLNGPFPAFLALPEFNLICSP